ncbi:MAG: ABC transporter permease [Acidimicrobiia bacterium]
MTKLVITESKLFVRDRAALFWGLAFPAVVFVALGAFFPGFRDPVPEIGGRRLIDLYAPIVLVLALATVAFTTLPVMLATYREFGILRRMRTTPVHPGRLLAAQLGVHVAVATAAMLLTLTIGVLAFDIELPANMLGFVAVFVLAAASMLAMGLFIGSVAKTASAGQGIGMAVYFPMLFFAGIYFPREGMPESLRRVSDFTPAGAAVQAMSDVWAGAGPSLSSVAVMAGFAVVAGGVAARLFRWE